MSKAICLCNLWSSKPLQVYIDCSMIDICHIINMPLKIHNNLSKNIESSWVLDTIYILSHQHAKNVKTRTKSEIVKMNYKITPFCLDRMQLNPYLWSNFPFLKDCISHIRLRFTGDRCFFPSTSNVDNLNCYMKYQGQKTLYHVIKITWLDKVYVWLKSDKALCGFIQRNFCI